MCVDVKLHISAGGPQPIFLCYPTKLRKMWWMGSWTHEPVPALYIYIVPPLGAYKSQLGGTYILSLLFYTVNVYCDYTSIYYCIRSHSSCQFIVGVFARPLHSTSEFAKTVLSKCVIHAGFVTVA